MGLPGTMQLQTSQKIRAIVDERPLSRTDADIFKCWIVDDEGRQDEVCRGCLRVARAMGDAGGRVGARRARGAASCGAGTPTPPPPPLQTPRPALMGRRDLFSRSACVLHCPLGAGRV